MAERGRPRTFDRTDALRRAMRVFWAKGYAGATLAELTEAMGIKPPSLYAAFGDKDRLFHEAVALYGAEEGGAPLRALQAAPTLRAGLQAMLRAAVALYTGPGRPAGCLVVTTAVLDAAPDSPLALELAGQRQRLRAALGTRLALAVKEGELAPGTDCAGLAEFYAAVLNGLSVRARDGASRKALLAAVGPALAVLSAAAK